jgi:hypothetical protein
MICGLPEERDTGSQLLWCSLCQSRHTASARFVVDFSCVFMALSSLDLSPSRMAGFFRCAPLTLWVAWRTDVMSASLLKRRGCCASAK